MKLVVLITLFTIIHHSRATKDISELTNIVKMNLQVLHDTAASQLGKIKAAINSENAKKADVFNIIPKISKLKSLLTGDKKETLILDPEQPERLSHYFEDNHHQYVRG